jgi:hypothetical protein
MTASLLLFALVGLAEWLLAIWRLRACVSGRGWLAASLVVLETLLGLWVFREFAAGNNLAGVAYAVGGGLGTWLGVGKKKGE